MKTGKTIHLFLLLLIFNLNLRANGGPIDGSAVYKTGDIVLIKQDYIKLEKEDLKIKLDGDYSIVKVKYLLLNQSSESNYLTYGFPIDIMHNESIGNTSEWMDEYIPEIEISANGSSLPIKRHTDYSLLELDYSSLENKSIAPDSPPVHLKRNWFVVDFKINSNDSLVLSVNYKIKNGFIDWSTSKNFFESYSAREIIYDFSPAQYWSDGIVNSINIEIDATSIIKNKGELHLNGTKMSNNSGIFTKQLRNFDLKNSKSLVISYIIENEKKSAHMLLNRIPPSKIKSVAVSSQLEGDYSKMNLFDNDFETAWVEGSVGSGIGDQITIELNGINLSSICIVNGYAKSAETYTNNNRLKKAKIELAYEDINFPKEVSEIEIEDLPYTKINLNNFSALTSELGDNSIFPPSNISRITITILDVYQGKKYNDTCITELILLGYDN